jgi:hypothetical protein
VKFSERMQDIQVARNDNGDHLGWIGKMGDSYTWVVPDGRMSIDPHTGNGNFISREEAHRMLVGMYERPEIYGFKREDWAPVWH